ncbi:uncharacterized protein Kaz-m1 [Battus philenor]|uniref:uncharacterized protein Kaz-m1 n=1 Tax=Battus philenor TaxID=42288 RepID=UPI0035CF365C
MMLDSKCNDVEYIPVRMNSCVPDHNVITRKMYMESCPAFCPSHYRPVCGVSKLRNYEYRTFTNGCHIDLLNCRGGDDYNYVEVPLKYCQGHLMKNIFKEQIILSSLDNYREHLS